MRKSNITIYSTLALVAFLSACRMGKDYQRSELSLPTQFANTTATADSSVADMEWKKFFSDPTLQSLIGHALDNSFDVQLAMKRVDEARAYAKQAKVNWGPTISANLTAASTFPSKNSLNGISLKNFLGKEHLEDYNLNAGLNWEIDIWGKLSRQREAANAQYLQSFEASRAVQTALVANIASSYYNLLMLDAQLAVAQRSVSLGDTIVQFIALQKQAGQATELAVQQATSQQQTAKILIPQLEQQIAIQENTIHILSGDQPGTIARTLKLQDYKTLEQLPNGVPAAVVSRRPDVRSNEMALKSANARVGVAEASLYPTLSITASGGLNAYEFAKWFNIPGSLFATGLAGISQPIFQRRALKTQFEVAKLQRDEAAISFRQSAYNAMGEVANALVSIDKLKSQFQLSNEQVSLSNSAIGNAKLLYKSGLADYLEVITAQSNLLQAELYNATIQRDQLSAMVELYRALGGGWK